MDSIQEKSKLHNGVGIPGIGFGTYKMADGDEVKEAVLTALQTGYRMIDTAEFYGNENGIGDALRSSLLPREEIFLVSKLWNNHHGYKEAREAFFDSLERLKTDFLDLYLIHWPTGKNVETWKAMEELYFEGRIRAIGVSNFNPPHIKDLIQNAEIVPMVNQVEFHPYLVQRDLLSFCLEHDIRLEAWSPLMRGKVLRDSVIQKIAENHGKTPAQVVLRWDMQLSIITIPKSVTPERIQENADVFDFSLSQEEMDAIFALNRNERHGPDPDAMAGM